MKGGSMLEAINPQRSVPWAGLVLRVALGAVFIAHAYAKAGISTFPDTMAYFESVGFPGWTVYPVFVAEFFGGLCLLAGLQVRAVAVVLGIVMLGALKPHLGNGWLYMNPGGGWEYVAFLLAALVALFLVGPGAYALRLSALQAGKPHPSS